LDLPQFAASAYFMTTTSAKKICLYLQIHQPYRVNPVEKSQITHYKDLFQGLKSGKQGLDMTNETIFEKVALSCYIPTTKFWLQQCRKHPNLKLTLSFSGTFLEQCLEFPRYGTQVLDLFRELLATGQLEILDETYYHSLSFMIDLEEYLRQIQMHRDLIKQIFDYSPTSFRNTELIYNNQIGNIIQNLGYKTQLIENPQTPGLLFKNTTITNTPEEQKLFSKHQITTPNPNLILLPRDIAASDGIIFPDSVENRLQKALSEGNKALTCIFTDYEFLGEHDFGNLDNVYQILADQLDFLLESGYIFTLPSEIADSTNSSDLASFDCPKYTSWAHTEKDISVWIGGEEQNQAFDQLQKLYNRLKTSDNPELMQAWRKLSTSCHFYFLGRKSGTDGDFVDLFSPYESVDLAFENYMQVAFSLEKMLEDSKI
jgi:alpha-amylase